MPLEPADPSMARITRRTLLGCLGLAGLAGAGLLWQRRPNRWRSGFTIHFLTPEFKASDPSYLVGLHWVIQAHLATLAPACVLSVPDTETQLPPRQSRAFQLQLLPSRHGDQLCLGFRWRRAEGTWIEIQGKPQMPAAAVADFLAKLPEHFAPDREARMLPLSPGASWELFELASTRPALFHALGMRERLERLAAQAPDCALVWCLFGCAAYRELLTRNDWISEDRALAESCLRRALDLTPGLPFAASELAQLHSDFGENRAALEVLSEAIWINPYSEVLLRRLAYSARNGGLLSVAGQALRKREALMGHLGGIENTLLYLGEIDRFEEGILTEVRGKDWKPAHRFFMGYAALMRGDRTEALKRLREAKGVWSEARFGRIGFALWTFLEGRAQESLEALELVVQQHLSLRAPDGEFIVKLAELMALHGKEHRAADLAIRAASHGFGCVQWYERSPFLDPIRDSVRFQALLHTLRERHAALADRFPLNAFGF